MASSSSKPARFIISQLSISILVTACILLLTQETFLDFLPLKRAELSLIDLRFKQRGGNRDILKSSNIIIVAISQESFKSLPEKWPWPRSYYTRLVRNLEEAGAKAIGIDVIITSTGSRNPHDDEEFRKELKKAHNIVLAGKLETEHRHGILREQSENYGNIFIDSTSRIGLVNARADADGVLRRYMPFVYDDVHDKRIPTFSMAMLNAYFAQSPAYTPEIINNFVHYLDRQIPLYDATSFLTNYYGPSGSFRRINIVDVLDDKEFQTLEELQSPGLQINTFDNPEYGYLQDGTFKDKIVLIGSTTPEDKDLFPVSIGEGRQEGDNMMYGVEIHANVIQSILDNNFIARAPLWMTSFVVFGLSLFTLAFTAGLKTIRTKHSTVTEILSVAFILAELFIIYRASIELFIQKNFLVEMTSPFLAVIVSYIGNTVYGYVTERKQKVLIKSMFSRYVNPTIVDELVAHPEKLQLGGERKILTVFFSDIENFTQISEKLPPEKLVAILNEYLSVMTSLILSNNGTLDKYEGDAIVAFWGAPVPQPDHAIRACRTSVQMQESLNGLRQLWQQEGKPQLRVRIGINTGEMIVGNMGGVSRFDYTVIGDSVNLGARLEGVNKQFKTSILISESTYKKVQGRAFARELDLLLVAGKTEPIRVYELIGFLEDGIPSEREKLCELYASGLKFFRQREWNRAIEAFQKGLDLVPNDYPSKVYIERSAHYRASPPPANWNGVFIMSRK